MDRAALARRIKEVAYLTGQFTLRSGAISSFYWDKYRFESDPAILAAVAEGLADILPAGPGGYDGSAIGGQDLLRTERAPHKRLFPVYGRRCVGAQSGLADP